MYKIQNMQRLRHFMLTWCHAEDGPTYIVGDVTQNESSDDWKFRYPVGTPDMGAAEQKGFISYPGLPMSHESIVAGVRQTFSTRVPSPQRTDYDIFLNHWHFSRDQRLQTMDVLGYTGGLLPRDTFRFVPFFESQRPFDFVTEVQGTKHWAKHIEGLKVDDRIELDLKLHTELLSSAPCLLSEKGKIIGTFVTGLGAQVKKWMTTQSVICNVAQINGNSANPRLVLAVQVGFLNTTTKIPA